MTVITELLCTLHAQLKQRAEILKVRTVKRRALHIEYPEFVCIEDKL